MKDINQLHKTIFNSLVRSPNRTKDLVMRKSSENILHSSSPKENIPNEANKMMTSNRIS